MKRKMSTNDVKSLHNYVIKTIDRWWVDTTNRKQGYFTRSNIDNSSVTYKDYAEWRYSNREDFKDYVSMFISLEYENGMDYIRLKLRKKRNGIYSEYDPFCEIHDGKVDVTISEDTGGYDEQFSVFEDCFNELTDRIATAVSRFTELPSYYEGCMGVNINGLTTKEFFVLDTSYFVIGDIYLLEIDSIYDWSKISMTPIKIPRWIYAICEDVCSTVIDFMLGGIEGRDGLLRMPVHADEIESGLITVKRVLMNETLIQTEDEECL